MRSSRLAFAFLLLAATGNAGALDLNGTLAGAGRLSLSLAQTAESYDEFWVGATKVAEPALGEIDNDSSALHLSWGFREDWAVVANLAYVKSEASGPAGLSESGLQDLTVLVQHRFWRADGHALVAALGGRTPLDDYLANGPVSIGDETSDVLARLVYRYECGGWSFAQQVGFDLRGGDAPDGIPLATELGYAFARVDLALGYNRYFADGGTDIGQPGFTFPSTGDEFERLSLKVFGRITDEIGLSVSGFTTLDGRNVGDAEGLSVGLTYFF